MSMSKLTGSESTKETNEYQQISDSVDQKAADYLKDLIISMEKEK